MPIFIESNKNCTVYMEGRLKPRSWIRETFRISSHLSELCEKNKWQSNVPSPGILMRYLCRKMIRVWGCRQMLWLMKAVSRLLGSKSSIMTHVTACTRIPGSFNKWLCLLKATRARSIKSHFIRKLKKYNQKMEYYPWIQWWVRIILKWIIWREARTNWRLEVRSF